MNHEAAAVRFLALLAYPESAKRRARAAAAMRAFCRRRRKKAGTVIRLGKVMPVQQMKNQMHLINGRLYKRQVAAHDCVKLDMGLVDLDTGLPLSLNALARGHAADGEGFDRYKSDWWVPEVMPLALVIHGLRISSRSREPLKAEALLQSCDWAVSANELAVSVAEGLLRTHTAAPLRGFKSRRFLYPKQKPLS